MADITITTEDSGASVNWSRSNRCLVYTTASNGYVFYINTTGDLVYRKTTDGGSSWGSPVTVNSASILAVGCWYDPWTPGNTDPYIHLWYVDFNTGPPNGAVKYRALDTSDDSLGTERTIAAATGASAGYGTYVSGARMRGGNLLCVYAAEPFGTDNGTYRSTDDGVTWGSRSNVMEGAARDFGFVFPGNEADDNDAWILFHDASANELTLKVHDDSANSNSESSNIVTVAESTTDGAGQWSVSGSIRHSDGHLILAAFTEFDTATGDFVVYDVNGTGSISALANIATNKDDMYYPSVYIDQGTDDLYVAYSGKSDGTESIASTGNCNVYYAKSSNGGSSWSVDNAYAANAVARNRQTFAPLSGDRFAVAWRNSQNFTVLTNHDNSLDLTPAAGGITGPLVGAGHLSGNGPLVGGRLVG